jgi:hypothetical protein
MVRFVTNKLATAWTGGVVAYCSDGQIPDTAGTTAADCPEYETGVLHTGHRTLTLLRLCVLSIANIDSFPIYIAGYL